MNLTSLRNYRVQLEGMLRAELAELERVLQAVLDKHRRWQTTADDDMTRFMIEARRGLSAKETATRYMDWQALGEKIQRAEAIVTDAREQRDRKRAEVLGAARERKKLDLLITRRMQRRRGEEQRREQRALDEAASRRRRRSNEV
jgi:flagellar export protein FliJ